MAKKLVAKAPAPVLEEKTSVTVEEEEPTPSPMEPDFSVPVMDEPPRAEACVLCTKEYTFRKMGTGSPYEGKPVCTGCLPKALAAEGS